LRAQFCGVRGSTPVAGPDFARVGGHTSCLALSGGDELPSLILDAGTGLQTLAPRFGTRSFTGTIVLTHLHWDHLQGLPFFPPADRTDAHVVLAQPAQGDPVTVLERAMSPPHFPIGPNGLRGTWEHRGLAAEKHSFGAFSVTTRDVVHKGGRTFGIRVEHGGSSLAYVPDALDANDDAILDLAYGVDVLVRGTPFTAEESERADAFGHGTVEHAVDIAREAGARRLILTHHAPTRTDAEVAHIAARSGAEVATEGLVIDV